MEFFDDVCRTTRKVEDFGALVVVYLDGKQKLALNGSILLFDSNVFCIFNLSRDKDFFSNGPNCN